MGGGREGGGRAIHRSLLQSAEICFADFKLYLFLTLISVTACNVPSCNG